jgi:hypothetical protein
MKTEFQEWYTGAEHRHLSSCCTIAMQNGDDRAHEGATWNADSGELNCGCAHRILRRPSPVAQQLKCLIRIQWCRLTKIAPGFTSRVSDSGGDDTHGVPAVL